MDAQQQNAAEARAREEETLAESFPGVFINAPFDRTYEPLFATLVCTLVCLRFRPHSVLEVRERGEGRLKRIYDLMRACPVSIHDLTRCGSPPRFNMPFELGLACAIQFADPTGHEVVVMESRAYRADRTISDYKGHDLLIHGGTCAGMVAAVVDAFPTGSPDMLELRRASREIRRSVQVIKADLRSATVFRPAGFRELVAVSDTVARRHGFLAL